MCDTTKTNLVTTTVILSLFSGWSLLSLASLAQAFCSPHIHNSILWSNKCAILSERKHRISPLRRSTETCIQNTNKGNIDDRGAKAAPKQRMEKQSTKERPTESLQTWRIFDINVHPDELANSSSFESIVNEKQMKRWTSEKHTEFQSCSRTYLTSAVVSSLLKRLKIEDQTAATTTPPTTNTQRNGR